MNEQYLKEKSAAKTDNPPMAIAIIENDPDCRKRWAQILLEETKRLGIPTVLRLYANGEDFLSDASEKPVTLAVTDIYIDRDKGLEVARKLRNLSPGTFLIFLTSSKDHYLEAFAVHAFDYIHKNEADTRLRKSLQDLARALYVFQPYFRVPGFKDLLIPYSDIRYVCTSGNYLELTSEGKCRFRMTFTALKNILLQDRRFLIVSRGVLVNLEHVQNIQDYVCLMDNGATFPLFQKKIRELTRTFLKWKFQEKLGESPERSLTAL